MIILDENERVGISEALQGEYVQGLMDKYDVKRKLRNKRRERQLREFHIPYDKGLATVLRYLGDQIEHENCVEGVLAWIAQTQCQNRTSTNPLLPILIWKVFLVHNENPTIFQYGLEILIHCTSIGEMKIQTPDPPYSKAKDPTSQEICDAVINNSIYWNENTLNLISELAKRHSEHLQVHERVLALLEAIFCPLNVNDLTKETSLAYWSKYSPIYRSIFKMTYPELIIRGLMRVHDGFPDILRLALSIMWKLCIDEEHSKKFIEMDAFKLVYDVMFYWPKHPEIINQGALCLAALSSTRWLIEDIFMEYDIPTLLLNSIDSFCPYNEICYNLFYTVSSIINRSAEQRLRFVRPNTIVKEKNLIALILKAYSIHHDNDRIIGIIVKLISAIMADEAIFSVIPILKALLTDIYSRFHDCRELGSAAQEILQRIPEAYTIPMDAIEPQIVIEFKMLSI
nr:protein kinase core [Hymenolepis microstoma]